MSPSSQSPKHEEFMALFVRYEPTIHSFLTSLLANLDDAEVVMQETSMAMWKKFDQFETGTSFRNWAFQIARFEAMNLRRKRQRGRHFFSDELVRLDPSLVEMKNKLPSDPFDLVVESIWCHTLDEQAGLEVTEVELIPSVKDE